MTNLKQEVTEFSLVGQLAAFVIKDGYKIKYLRISIREQEYWIKLKKEIRYTLDPGITAGCWLSVSGERKLCLKTGKVKLKAYEVKLATALGEFSDLVPRPPENVKSQQSKASILVCQKSDCWSRGGKEICQALEESLQACGLKDRVTIKPTGCIKQCKQGPNLIVMPDKAYYNRVQPTQIPILVEKHFNASTV